MGKLNVFNFITLNGFYKGPNDDISWNKHDAEENAHAEESVEAGPSTLLFGRVTYEMMAGYWSSQMALEMNPIVAGGMNNSEKIVFSRTLEKADWQNKRLVKDDLIGEVKRLKAIPEKNLTILGSGSIVSQLAEAGLIDSYQLMLNPVALGGGTPIFHGISGVVKLKLQSAKVFKSGVVLLDYVLLEP